MFNLLTTRVGQFVCSFFSVAILAMAPLTSSALSFEDTPSGKYVVEKTHAYVTFSYSHLGFSNPVLRFDKFDIDLDFNQKNPEKSSFVFTIDADSINSGAAILDQHMREDARLLDTKKHPKIVFRSKKISQITDDKYMVEGNLTVKKVSKPVSLLVTINNAGFHYYSSYPTIGLTAEATINRSDWGLTYTVPMVSDKVDLLMELELINSSKKTKRTPLYLQSTK